uniref:Uncharacterized protein n=1 Tax=Lotharella globosa TaxID=91324 RepID=A0A7S4DNR1_9EUKA
MFSVVCFACPLGDQENALKETKALEKQIEQLNGALEALKKEKIAQQNEKADDQEPKGTHLSAEPAGKDAKSEELNNNLEASLDFGDLGIGFGEDEQTRREAAQAPSQQKDDELRNELRLKQDQLEEANARVSQLEQSKQALLDQTRDLQDKLQEAKAASERYQAEIGEIKARVEQMEHELELARSSASESSDRCAEKDRQNQRLRDDIEKMRDEQAKHNAKFQKALKVCKL